MDDLKSCIAGYPYRRCLECGDDIFFEWSNTKSTGVVAGKHEETSNDFYGFVCCACARDMVADKQGELIADTVSGQIIFCYYEPPDNPPAVQLHLN